MDDYEFSEGEEKQDIFTKDEYSGEGYYFTDIETDYDERCDVTHKFVKKVLAKFNEKKLFHVPAWCQKCMLQKIDLKNLDIIFAK